MSLIESKDVGANVRSARLSADLTQTELARRSGVSRTQIVKMEAGRIFPQLDEAIRLADALHVPIQRLISGRNRQSEELKGIAQELYGLGIRDFIVAGATVSGAFRRPEQVLALALRGDRPEARIVEAIPFVLSRNRIHVRLTLAFADLYDPRVKSRLAWLSDLTITLARLGTLTMVPEVERRLEKLIKSVKKPEVPDDLGSPEEGRLSPIWRRWNVTYSGSIKAFQSRAGELSAGQAKSPIESIN